MKSWKELIVNEMEVFDESWENVISNTLPDDELEKKFDNYCCSNEASFTLWTKNRVYFPVGYDSCLSVGSVSRNPDGNPTNYFGGGV